VHCMLQTNRKSAQRRVARIFKLYASFQSRRPGVRRLIVAVDFAFRSE